NRFGEKIYDRSREQNEKNRSQAEWNLVSRNMEIWRNFPASFSFVLMAQNQHRQAVESETPDDPECVGLTQDIHIAAACENSEQLEKDDQIDDAVRGSKAWMRLSEPVGEDTIF